MLTAIVVQNQHKISFTKCGGVEVKIRQTIVFLSDPSYNPQPIVGFNFGSSKITIASFGLIFKDHHTKKWPSGIIIKNRMKKWF